MKILSIYSKYTFYSFINSLFLLYLSEIINIYIKCIKYIHYLYKYIFLYYNNIYSFLFYLCLFVCLSQKCFFIYWNNILVSADGSWCSCGWSWFDSNHSRKLFPIPFSVLYIRQKSKKGGEKMQASIEYDLSSHLSIINKMDRAALLFQYHYKTFGVMVLDWNGIDWWWDAAKGGRNVHFKWTPIPAWALS